MRLISCSGPEVSLLDYVTQQEKLFPAIASVFAFIFVSKQLRNMYEENESRLHESQDFSLLAEVHLDVYVLVSLLPINWGYTHDIIPGNWGLEQNGEL